MTFRKKKSLHSFENGIKLVNLSKKSTFCSRKIFKVWKGKITFKKWFPPPPKQPSIQVHPKSKDTRSGEGFFLYKDCNVHPPSENPQGNLCIALCVHSKHHGPGKIDLFFPYPKGIVWGFGKISKLLLTSEWGMIFTLFYDTYKPLAKFDDQVFLIHKVQSISAFSNKCIIFYI